MKIKILKEGAGGGRLGKHAWPSADTRYKDPELRPEEPDTDIEEKLYKELHAHFGAILDGVPLSKESIEAIKQILDNGEYPDIFKRCTGKGAVVRGMRVSVEWLEKNAPEALESWSTENEYDWNTPVKADFGYNSKGSYGSVSSWAGARFWDKAREFASTWRPNQPANAVSCILYASCESGLFLNTQAFTKFIGGRYKKDFDIRKLNPQGGIEGEVLLLGDCRINAIQLYGAKPSMSEAVDSTTKLEPKNQEADNTWRGDESPNPTGWDNSTGWGGISNSTPSEKATSTEQGPEAVLAAKGFENIKKLGSGMVGNVYSADWHSGLEVAVKVVPKGPIETRLPNGGTFRWSGEKEIRAYEGIMKARGQSKNMERHFPEVFAIMPGGANYYIFMERLTDEGPYTAVIDELFAGIESLVDPGKDLIDQGAYKDPSRRLFMYLKDEKSRNILLDRILDNINPEGRQKAKEWAYNWYKWVGADKVTQPMSYEMIDELFTGDGKAQDIFLDGFGNLQKEFEDNSWMSYVALKILEVVKQYDLQGFHMNYKDIAKQWVDLGRKGAPIGWYHRPPTKKAAFGGVEDDIASVYKEAESIKLALDDLESIMGLVGTDMHDKNVMMRPLTGDIVIVDVGLFKPRAELNEVAPEPEEDKPGEQTVEVTLNKHKLEEALYEMNFNTTGITFKKELNPKIWLKKQLVAGIREKLLEIASNFLEDSEIEDNIEDIILTGSIVDYNWHKNSDIDLHIVVDYKKFGEDGEFVKKIMDLERMRWNEVHRVMISGHEIEIYVQDIDEDHYAGGIYSLKADKWTDEPLQDAPEVDFNVALKKAEGIVDDIKTIQYNFSEKDHEQAHKNSSRLKEKIRKMRSAGLEEAGVWSPENIAFKLLRNSGFMAKLRDLHTQSYDKMMGISKNKGNSQMKIRIVRDVNEGWAVKSNNKGDGGSGFGSLSKPKYMVSMDMAGAASKAAENGEELYGWDKYAQLVAQAYENGPEEAPAAVDAFKRLGHHVIKNIKKVQSAYSVEFVDGQPYDSAVGMANDIKKTGIMKISKDFNQSEVFGENENLYFRAVHDYYGHMKAQGHEKDPSKITKFNLEGELKAYNHHLMMLRGSEMAKAVFTEVIGQACYFMYHGKFPDQKVFFLDGFDHVNIGRVKGYKIVNGELVSTSRGENTQ